MGARPILLESMKHDIWLRDNRTALTQRLEWLRDQPDGVLYSEPAGSPSTVVTKTGTQLRLLLVEEADSQADLIQSRLDLKDPLHLVSAYSQAVMLALAWNSQPTRIYMVGLGGGRIPLVLHHYLPQARIECAEIEPRVVEAATRFFGLQMDQRLVVTLQDGRDYLAKRGPHVQYDLLIVDAVLSNGFMPYGLVTEEFYDLCQAHLSPDGVLAVNLLRNYPFFSEKIRTIQSAFKHVHLCPVAGGNAVVFASQGNWLDTQELVQRSKALQTCHDFSFPLPKHASAMYSGSTLHEYVFRLSDARSLTDSSPPDGYLDYGPIASSVD
jgi:spermidine synthase